MSAELSPEKIAKIEKLEEVFGKVLRSNPDLLDIDMEYIIDKHWIKLEEELIESFIAALNRMLVRTRNMVRIKLSTKKRIILPKIVKEIESDIAFEPGKWILTFEEYLESNELSIKGEVMLDRAIESEALAGVQHALALLAAEELIPDKFLGKKFMIFAGTIGLSTGGRRRVPCIVLSGRKWALSWEWLAREFGIRGFLVRARKNDP